MSVPYADIPPEHSMGHPFLIASRHTPLSIWEVAQLLSSRFLCVCAASNGWGQDGGHAGNVNPAPQPPKHPQAEDADLDFNNLLEMLMP